MTPFVPEAFAVPQRLVHAAFILRPLLITDVVKDYDAVMSSVEHLQGVFGPGSDWPVGLSFEQDLIDLGWHHKEFQRRRSFAYTMMRPDEQLCLGCVYLYPSADPDIDAEIYCWVRASHAAALDQTLYRVVRNWVVESWPFGRVAYPGRDPAVPLPGRGEAD